MSNWKHGGDDQMTVGEIIRVLSAYPDDMMTRWNFLCPHSYRGFYDQVAVSISGYGQPVAEMRDVFQSCRDTFTGYKGGEFTMDDDTPVWVSEYGMSGIPLVRQFLFMAIGG